TTGEESKYRLHPDELMSFAERLLDYPRLKPKGLMTHASFSADTERVRTCIQLLRDMRDRAITITPGLTQQSMGCL
ncbi:YggS family pyridoxal phosphate-dependent enzyme, partial [Brucella oryzae]